MGITLTIKEKINNQVYKVQTEDMLSGRCTFKGKWDERARGLRAQREFSSR